MFSEEFGDADVLDTRGAGRLLRVTRGMESVHMAELLFTASQQAEAQTEQIILKSNGKSVAAIWPRIHFPPSTVLEQKKSQSGCSLPIHLIWAFVIPAWSTAMSRPDLRGRELSWLPLT